MNEQVLNLLSGLDQQGGYGLFTNSNGTATPAITQKRKSPIADLAPITGAATAPPPASLPAMPGDGAINLPESAFKTGGQPAAMSIPTGGSATPQNMDWLDSMLAGALGEESPERYDYGAPQENVPDSAKYGDKRNYRNFDEIVIEDSTGPNTAGTNRTVVSATERPGYQDNMKGYAMGKTFREQPRGVSELLDVFMGGGRQQAQAPRPPSAQVLQAIAAAQQQMAGADKTRRQKFAEADDFWFDSSRKKGRKDAQTAYDETVAPINAQMAPYRAQYPHLFGGDEGRAFGNDPEALMERLRRLLPSISPQDAAEIAAAMSQSG